MALGGGASSPGKTAQISATRNDSPWFQADRDGHQFEAPSPLRNRSAKVAARCGTAASARAVSMHDCELVHARSERGLLDLLTLGISGAQ